MIELSLTVQLFNKKAVEALKTAKFKQKVSDFIVTYGHRAFLVVYDLKHEVHIDESIKIIEGFGGVVFEAVAPLMSQFDPEREFITYGENIESWLYCKHIVSRSYLNQENDRERFKRLNPFIKFPNALKIDQRCKDLLKDLASVEYKHQVMPNNHSY